MTKVGDWFYGRQRVLTEDEVLDAFDDDLPDHVQEAMDTVVDYIKDEQSRAEREPELMTITRDQWEGLQFELSDIKAQLNNDPGPQGEWFDQFGSPEEEERVDKGNPEKDWGFEQTWRDRRPMNVYLVDGPPGLELGPFVLLQPHERQNIGQVIDELSELTDSSLDKIEELEAQLEAASGLIIPEPPSNPAPKPYRPQDYEYDPRDRPRRRQGPPGFVIDDESPHPGNGLRPLPPGYMEELTRRHSIHERKIEETPPLPEDDWSRLVEEGPDDRI